VVLAVAAVVAAAGGCERGAENEDHGASRQK
jgi:hypothetical protein